MFSVPDEIIDHIVGYLELADWIRFTQLTSRELSGIACQNSETICYLSREATIYSKRPLPDTGLKWAAAEGSIHLLKYFLYRGAHRLCSAMDKAAENGHLPVVQYVAGIIGIPDDAKTLKLAAKHGHLHVVKYIVEWGWLANLESALSDVTAR